MIFYENKFRIESQSFFFWFGILTPEIWIAYKWYVAKNVFILFKMLFVQIFGFFSSIFIDPSEFSRYFPCPSSSPSFSSKLYSVERTIQWEKTQTLLHISLHISHTHSQHQILFLVWFIWNWNEVTKLWMFFIYKE